MSNWQPLADLPETSEQPTIHALLWGRLHVSGMDRKWITDWKVLKCSWVRWTGTGINTSPRFADSWFHPTSGPCRIERIEATHFQPLPEPPEGAPRGTDPAPHVDHWAEQIEAAEARAREHRQGTLPQSTGQR